MRAVGYTRVSTEDQARHGDSLDAQRSAIATYCAANGHALDGPMYEDAGISGKSMRRREGLAAALESACASPSVLVIYSLSRMARSVPDGYAIAERLRKAGSKLESVSERIDLDSPSGRMMFGFLLVIAVYKVEETAEQTASTMRLKGAKGERTGALPLGSRVVADGRISKRGRPIAVVEAAEELAAIARIRALAAEGLGARPIARRLTEEGLAARGGGPWSESTIRGVLKRPEKSQP